MMLPMELTLTDDPTATLPTANAARSGNPPGGRSEHTRTRTALANGCGAYAPWVRAGPSRCPPPLG